MQQKQAVTRKLALKYKRASKKEKGEILDNLIELTGYNRSYAARVLRQKAKPKIIKRLTIGDKRVTLVEDERCKKKPRKRPRKYDQARTPFRRVLESSFIDKKAKKELRDEYKKLNPAALKRRITRLQEELARANRAKRDADKKKQTTQDLVYNFR